ncbi:MAG: hypothetical protein JXR83_14120 [Deltaproteobacteria bacterium]|nr:hypothetical protein [Deltaproteobacteria bacterium]
MKSGRWYLALAAVAVTAGCGFGEVAFSGDFGGRPFRPDGTAFGFVDALERVPELKPRDRQRAIAVATFAAFDPTVDQEQLPGNDLVDLRHAIAVSDWFSFWWRDRQQVVAGSSFTDVVLIGDSDGRYEDSDSTATGRSDGFQARFAVAREELGAGASYADYRPFGTRAVVTVHLTEASLDVGGRLRGSATFRIERLDSDPADAATGSVGGEFSAPIVGERIAEKNFETLDLYNQLEVSR